MIPPRRRSEVRPVYAINTLRGQEVALAYSFLGGMGHMNSYHQSNNTPLAESSNNNPLRGYPFINLFPNNLVNCRYALKHSRLVFLLAV